MTVFTESGFSFHICDRCGHGERVTTTIPEGWLGIDGLEYCPCCLYRVARGDIKIRGLSQEVAAAHRKRSKRGGTESSTPGPVSVGGGRVRMGFDHTGAPLDAHIGGGWVRYGAASGNSAPTDHRGDDPGIQATARHEESLAWVLTLLKKSEERREQAEARMTLARKERDAARKELQALKSGKAAPPTPTICGSDGPVPAASRGADVEPRESVTDLLVLAALADGPLTVEALKMKLTPERAHELPAALPRLVARQAIEVVPFTDEELKSMIAFCHEGPDAKVPAIPTRFRRVYHG